MKIIKIAILNNEKNTFSYLPIKNKQLKHFLLQRVIIPFKSSLKVGIVKKFIILNYIKIFKIKRIYKIIDFYPLFNNTYVFFLNSIYHKNYIKKRNITYYIFIWLDVIKFFKYVSGLKKKKKKKLYLKLKRSNYRKIKIYKYKFNVYILKSRYLIYKIYLEQIKNLIKKNLQILIVFPNKNYINEIKNYFQKFFFEKIYKIDSTISKKEKFTAWNDISSGRAKIIIGTELSLFFSFFKLGMIILHKSHYISYRKSYKYHLNIKSISIIKSKINEIPLLFASDLPSLNCYLQYKRGFYYFIFSYKNNILKYRKNYLIKEIGSSNNELISDSMLRIIGNFLNKKKQVILLICRKNYYIYKRHPLNNLQIIKYNSMIEKILNILKKNFSSIKTEYIDSHTIKNKKRINKILYKMRKKEINILVGTNVLKKYSFEKIGFLGLVGIHDLFNNHRKRFFECILRDIIEVINNNIDHETLLIMENKNKNLKNLNFFKYKDYISIIDSTLVDRQYYNLYPFLKKTYIYCFSKKKEKSFVTIIKIKQVLMELDNNLFVEGPVPYINTNSLQYFYWIVLVRNKSMKSIQKILYKLHLMFFYVKKKDTHFHINSEAF